MLIDFSEEFDNCFFYCKQWKRRHWETSWIPLLLQLWIYFPKFQLFLFSQSKVKAKSKPDLISRVFDWCNYWVITQENKTAWVSTAQAQFTDLKVKQTIKTSTCFSSWHPRNQHPYYLQMRHTWYSGHWNTIKQDPARPLWRKSCSQVLAQSPQPAAPLNKVLCFLLRPMREKHGRYSRAARAMASQLG